MSSRYPSLTAIVMAKHPNGGDVKTRLCIGSEALPREIAAQIARIILQCTIERLIQRWPVVLALSPLIDDELFRSALSRCNANNLTIVEQGEGDLGARINRQWMRFGFESPVAFFGADAPDIPDEALEMIPNALQSNDLAIGPTADGGYWTLAGRSHYPQVLSGIDWGTNRVYHQTCQRGADARLSIRVLPTWHDVDVPSDLLQLRRRLAEAAVPPGTAAFPGGPLGRLSERLNDLCGPLGR